MSVSGDVAVGANAVITVHTYEPVAYEEPAQGPVLTRIHVEERFSGDIDGDGVVEFCRPAALTGRPALSASSGSRARWPAGRHVPAAGRRHVEGNIVSGEWFVVPGSGTGELAGLRATGGFLANLGEGAHVHLDYRFE